ncbi:hypothetical protein OIO90_001119 [Microbotryomycetes sp. JL221]|nr:hypothetical protein OIO90_001119 [Microbotryomycetes sp. JL221]
MQAGALTPSHSQAWLTATHCLNPRNLVTTPIDSTSGHYDELFKAIKVIERANLLDELLTQYCNAVGNAFDIVQTDIDRLLARFEASEPSVQPSIIAELLHRIGSRITDWQRPILLLWRSSAAPLAQYRRSFLSRLYFALPPSFSPGLTVYLRSILFKDIQQTDWPLAPLTLAALLDRFDPLLFGLVYEHIERKVDSECRGVYDVAKLQELLSWVNGPVHKWLIGLYAKTVENGTEEAKKLLKPTFSRFDYHVHKTLARLRAGQMYELISRYPASQPALEDLKQCLVKTDQRTSIVNHTRQQLDRHLLHPGTDTQDIVSTYIALIRCLRIIDPPGVLLSRVADPTRKYLRSRDDTIRCIVSRLMEEESALAAELKAADAKPLHDAGHEAENYNDPKWTPDPVDAPADFRKSRGSDIIQMLVSIYDTKDVFIKELQVLLAQRLLAVKDYSLEKEIKNVEVFKARFGEASLAGCEVMIKDLQDSKRIDETVHERAQGVPLHATVVSRLFWPSFQPGPLKLPGQLGRAQLEYDRAFKSSRPDKKLRWLPQLGTVNITVDLKDRSLTLDVTPLQSAVLEMFSQQEIWTTDDLSIELMLMDMSMIRNALYFWNNKGVLKQLPDDTWQLLEFKDAAEERAPAHVIEEAQQAVQSVEAQQVEQMRIFWQYINGMLMNLGALPITRIHTTLNMLVPSYKGRTTDELVAFLEAMSAEGLVERTTAGSWKIVK